MSKHKRIHNFTGRNYAKFAGFVASRYGPPPKKKSPAGAANTDEGNAEKVWKVPIPPPSGDMEVGT